MAWSEDAADRGDNPGPGQCVENQDERDRHGQGPAIAVGFGGALAPEQLVAGLRGDRFVAHGSAARVGAIGP